MIQNAWTNFFRLVSSNALFYDQFFEKAYVTRPPIAHSSRKSAFRNTATNEKKYFFVENKISVDFYSKNIIESDELCRNIKQSFNFLNYFTIKSKSFVSKTSNQFFLKFTSLQNNF